MAHIRLPAKLDTDSVGKSWDGVFQFIKAPGVSGVELDASRLEFCDTAGLSFLSSLKNQAVTHQMPMTLKGLSGEIASRLSTFEDFLATERLERPTQPSNIFISTGKSLHHLAKDFQEQIMFLGELLLHFASTIRNPGSFPVSEVWRLAEKVGVQALGIVSLISFLIGLIMAFQSAITMKLFGAELYVADLVGISLVRELGPLMTAILLAGRTGAAFAAELGTMKVNEEIDALTTMGLKPVKFLVMSRVTATVLMAPVLTAYADLMGLVGGGVVFCSFGFPLVTYMHELDVAIKVVDYVGGTAKAFVFGFLVAAIGCLRGLQTRNSASSVGESTTSAVVSGLVLIVVADGIFSVVYYYLGI